MDPSGPIAPDGRGRARQAAAEAAAALVEPGMVVGLGTGDSAAWFVRALAARAAHGLHLAACVPTSTRTARLAASLGLPLRELDDLPGAAQPVHLTVDGADEIDPALRLLKGGGGALLREKLVAHASRRLIVVADEGKRVSRLGARAPLPVEVVPFGVAQTLRRIQDRFPGAALRLVEGTPVRSDGGNLLIDIPLGAEEAADPEQLHRCLKLLSGVIETGLFLHEAERALIGTLGGAVVEQLR
ncbi:MAG: ribose-5-phosphate isomerase RpiA [Myxococcota bacterium]|nr:ribose-5-phosphate isomerase RpiA [Myxococcota bacterium]